MIAAFWYIWKVNNWFDIAAEQLVCLAGASFPATVRAYLGGASEWEARELRHLAGSCGIKVDVEWSASNPNESLGVVALKKFCDSTPGQHHVLYFHAKNVTLKGVYGSKWRWMMNHEILVEWRERIEELQRYDAIGVCYKDDPVYGPIFAGNFWWANAEWLRTLPPISDGLDRFAYEKWLLSGPNCRRLSLISEGGDPHVDSYYQRYGNPQDRMLHSLVQSRTAYHSLPAEVPPSPIVTCILTSHRKPKYITEAISSVIGQSSSAWQLIIIDSGSLVEAGLFNLYGIDPRIQVVVSGETAELRHRVGIQAWCINECHRRGLVRGDLVCYLSDDDVYDPGIFAVWQEAARSHPDQVAWYGPADRCEVEDEVEIKVGELPLFASGIDLDSKIDGMQCCHRRGVLIPWPEEKSAAYHADGVWLSALGRAVMIHPIHARVGRHRHTSVSTFTRPNGDRAEARLATLLQTARVELAIGLEEHNRVGGLVDLIRSVKPQSVIEIGSNLGVSTEAFALLCERVVAVDCWPDSAVREAFLERLSGYRNVESYVARSPEAAARFADGEFELAYIDADHTYESAAADIRAWLPKVRPGGFISGHDFTPEFPDVMRAVRELMGEPVVFRDSSWLIQKAHSA